MIQQLWQVTVLLGCLLLLMLPLTRLPVTLRVIAVPLCLFVPIIPIEGLPIAAYVRGAIDDVSIVALAWAAGAAQARVRGQAWLQGRERRALQALIVVGGLVLYPAALGLGMTDPYQWGYAPRGMLLVVGAVAALFALRGHLIASGLLTLATLAFLFEVKTSVNYWDYLIDPMVLVFALAGVIRACWHPRQAPA